LISWANLNLKAKEFGDCKLQSIDGVQSPSARRHIGIIYCCGRNRLSGLSHYLKGLIGTLFLDF
jgi:superfamily II DNA helicase RecQ